MLVHRTNYNINISEILEETDATVLRYFLANFDDSFPKRSFIATIKPADNYISCIFTIAKEDSLFSVVLEELSYSRQLLNKTLLESREFSALLQSFDVYYFIFDGTKYTLKNTKDLITIFTGSRKSFEEYFTKNFHINIYHDDTLTQLNSMFANIESFVSNKYYRLLQENNKSITIHTLKTSTRSESIIIASMSMMNDNSPVINAYAESRDGLTGLYNKKAITELAVKKINEEKVPCTMIILDADHFKDCNDSYGHYYGDKVLATIASCICDSIKGKGIAGRIGGDEFMILLDSVEENQIIRTARNIRANIQWNITNSNPDNVITCSMGIARFPENGENYKKVFDLADKSLYIAKHRGRNCYILYKPEIHNRIFIENKQTDDRMTNGKFFTDSVNSELEILNQLDLIKEKKSPDLNKLLAMITEYLQISKVTVYGKNYDMLYTAGADSLDLRGNFLKQRKNYFKFFNKYGFLHLDNTNVLNSIDGEHYNFYREKNIASTLEIIVRNKSNEPFLICYDLYRPARTFRKDKIIFAILIARKISEIM